MPDEKKSINSRYLKFKSLKPSDWFLYKSLKEHYVLDDRALIVAGIRWLYAGLHDPAMKNMILSIITQIQHEDLDTQLDHTTYTEINKL